MISEQLLAQLEKEYGLLLQKVESDIPIQFQAKSSLSLLKDEEDSFYILKRIPPAYFKLSTPGDYFHGLSLFIRQVHAHEIPLVNYLFTQEGAVSLQYQEDYYVIYPYVSAAGYSGALEEVRSTASIHARMNCALKSMDPAEVDFIRRKIKNNFLTDEPLPVLLERVKEKLSSSQKNEVTKKISALVPVVEECLFSFDEKLYHSLPAGVAHKDVWPANILYDQNELKVILDPDEAMYIPRVRDVMYSIWCFSTLTAEGRVTSPDLISANAYLDAYVRAGELTTAEVRFLPEAAIRIWTEDFLHFMLKVNLSRNHIPGLEEKMTYLTDAVAARSAWGF